MLIDAPFACNKKKLLTISILLVTILNGYGRRFSSDSNSIECRNQTCIKNQVTSCNVFQEKGLLHKLTKVIFRCAIWWMWKERCSRIFECQHTNNVQLLTYIIRDSRSCMENDIKMEHLTQKEKDIFIKFNFAIS